MTTATATAPDHHVRGFLLVGAATLLFSSGGLIVRSLETADPWTTVFWRSATATAFLLVFLLVRDGRNTARLFRDMGWPGIVVGLSFTLASVGFVVALSFASVAQTLVIMSAAPLIAAGLGVVVLGERVGPAGYVAIGAVMAGIALMMGSDLGEGRSFVGALIALAVAFGIAGAIITMRRFPDIRMTPAACTGTAVAMLIAWPLAAPLSVSGHDMALLAFFGAGQLGVGLALLVTGARLLPAAQTALLGTLEPILGPAWVWLLLAERPPAATLAGGALVLAAVLANALLGLRRRRGGA